MKISEIMSVNSIVLSLKANNKRQLLQALAEKAAEITGISERTIFDTILERENLGSTGFGGGTALPHGRLAELNKVYGFFARLHAPLDFDAIDDKPGRFGVPAAFSRKQRRRSSDRSGTNLPDSER